MEDRLPDMISLLDPDLYDPCFDISVVDAETGESLDHLHIFLANARDGWYEHYVRVASGDFLLNEGRTGLLTRRVERPIRFVRRAGSAS